MSSNSNVLADLKVRLGMMASIVPAGRSRLLSYVVVGLLASVTLLSLGVYNSDIILPKPNSQSANRLSWWRSQDDVDEAQRAKDAEELLQTGHQPAEDLSTVNNDNINEVFNTTLGFEQIFMISLPERGDRQDAFTVLAEVSNFTWTLMEGVRGKDVVNKSLPMGMTAEKIGVNGIGSWRAHMNTIRHIVYNKIESALIFEDDADWDVTLRYQLKQYAQATRWLLNQEERGVPFSPYGDGWDVLTIGHCDSEPWKSDMRRWVIPNDPTVILPHLRTGAWIPDMKPWQAWDSTHPKASNQTRVCYTADWVACTTAYALSLRGATKLLYWMSMMPFGDKFDNGLGWTLRNRHERSEVLGIGCFPTYVGISHGAGTGAKFSDIDNVGGTHDLPYSERVQFATRQNVDRLLRGNTTFVGSYTVEEIEQAADKKKRTPYLANFEDIISPQGYPEMVVKNKREDGTEFWESIPASDYYELYGPIPGTDLGEIE